MLAELLGWPMATFAMRIQTDDGGKVLTVGREVDTGIITVKLQTPALLTASDRIIHPQSVKNGVTPADFVYPEAEGGRYATLKGIMAAKKKPIDEMSLAAVGGEAKPAVEYVSFELPPRRTGQTAYVESVPDLVKRLHSEAKVI
jgi:electron transfer flavoprotein beta subunit